MEVNTVIIGSGISGLSAAHFLHKRTNDFIVLESQNNIGGIIQTKKEQGFICENGPNTVLLNNDAIIELVKDVGFHVNSPPYLYQKRGSHFSTQRHVATESESPLYACPRQEMGGADFAKSTRLSFGYKLRAENEK